MHRCRLQHSKIHSLLVCIHRRSTRRALIGCGLAGSDRNSGRSRASPARLRSAAGRAETEPSRPRHIGPSDRRWIGWPNPTRPCAHARASIRARPSPHSPISAAATLRPCESVRRWHTSHIRAKTLHETSFPRTSLSRTATVGKAAPIRARVIEVHARIGRLTNAPVSKSLLLLLKQHLAIQDMRGHAYEQQKDHYWSRRALRPCGQRLRCPSRKRSGHNRVHM